jgi:Spy/CpxP family protein refolding chaperone
MKTRILTIMLVISGLFNLLFLFGYFETRASAEKSVTPESPAPQAAVPEGRGQMMERLGLTDAQRQAMMDLRRKVGQHMREANQAREANNRAILAEMAQTPPDRQKIRQLMMDTARLQAETSAFRQDQLAEFLQTLSPQQRHAVLQMLNLPGGHRPPGPMEPNPGARP